jgi:hypothetical protein
MAELGHGSLDPVKGSRGHHAQRRNLIWPANPDALLLKDAPQHQGVPERDAPDRPGDVHHGNALFFDGALSGIESVVATGSAGVKRNVGLLAVAATPVNLPQAVSVPDSGTVVAVPAPLHDAKPAPGAVTAVRAAKFFKRPPKADSAKSEHLTIADAAASPSVSAFLITCAALGVTHRYRPAFRLAFAASG